MTFLRPDLLWLGALLPLLLAGYGLLCWRRLRLARRAAPLLQHAAGRVPRWQRQVAPLLLLAALATLVAATAGPTVVLSLTTEQQTLILAMDASGSMQARDIAPNRLAASQAAARELLVQLPRQVRVGVVSYSDGAQLMQAPTVVRDDARAAIDRITVEGGTAIGEGIVLALTAIFPEQRIGVPGGADPSAVERASKPPAAASRAVRPGSYRSAAIVLLTDGKNTAGCDPHEAARLAAAHGVKVYTVGFGTRDGRLNGPENLSVPVGIEEDTLKDIAATTGGAYFRADSGAELSRIYRELQSRLDSSARQVEVTGLFALAAAILTALGAGVSLWWFGKIA